MIRLDSLKGHKFYLEKLSFKIVFFVFFYREEVTW